MSLGRQQCLALFVLTAVFLLINLSIVSGDCKCEEPTVGSLRLSCSGGDVIHFALSYRCSKDPLGVTDLTVTSTSNDQPLTFGIGVFSPFMNVQSISLSAVHPSNLSKNLMTSQVVLRRCDLSRNNLTEISPRVFSSQFESLTFLNLSHNLFSSLPDNFLSKFSLLDSIDLSYNLLTTLPADRPLNWPLSMELLLHHNPLPPCWRFSNRSFLIKEAGWRCDNYTAAINGEFQEAVSLQCNETSEETADSRTVWFSPHRKFFLGANDTTWRLFFYSHFEPSSVVIAETGNGPQLFIDRMRPYFSGVWACLRVRSNGNSTVVSVISQVLLSCRSKLQSTYHWSLIVSGICTVVMILAGLLCGFGRLIWITRCFTREVHIISTMSLHDLQYSPRFAEQRHTILRRASELRKLHHSSSMDPSISSAESFIPAWLPPHRQRSVDPFAHGGGPYSDSESIQDFTTDDEEAEEGDTIDNDDHRTRSRVEDLRERFRRDMVKRVDHVRTRMRESKHTMEEGTSKVMRSLRSGSSVAASKMRSGLYNSVESVKFQVKAVTDFCGGGSTSIGQTVSVSTLDTDLDTQTTTERRIVDVTAV